MLTKDSSYTIRRSAAHFISGTFLSRITGMLRDMSMAYCFGTGVTFAAFLIAFRFSNLLRRLLGEGAFLNGFVPQFESLRNSSSDRGTSFFRDLFCSLALFLVLLVLGLELGLFAVKQIAPSEILSLTMLLLPGLIFICLFGLCSALLECEKNFFIPGVAPVAFNAIWILGVWMVREKPIVEAMAFLSGFVVLAFFFQWLVTMPHVLRWFFREKIAWGRPKFFSKQLRSMISPLLFGVVGVAAVQINSALDVIMARFANPEGPAYLSFAHRLVQLPLALFGVAVASALLPPLARRVVEGDTKKYYELLRYALSRSFSILMPGTIAIFVLGGASVNLLYGRGNFDQVSTINTVTSLWGYGIGLIPAAFVLIVATAFYAKKDYKTPARGSLIAVLINIAFNLFFVFGLKLGTMSVALATSISAFFNLGYLLKKLGVVRLFKGIGDTLFKTTSVALVCGFFTLLTSHHFMNEPTLSIMNGACDVLFARSFFLQCMQFTLLTSVYGLSFLGLSALVGNNLLVELIFRPAGERTD